MTVTNSTFAGNSVDFNPGTGGGGIWLNTGSLSVTNSTFSGNRAELGAGIYNYLGAMTVTNSTFAGNSTDKFGGGILLNQLGATSFLKSTMLAASFGGNCVGTVTDERYNISDDPTCAFGAIGSQNSTDPKLDPAGLANNGGPTQTIALLDGSPAIDAIPLADCADQASPLNPVITDQRSFPRPDAGKAFCDIGAYEVQDTPFIPFSRFGGGLKIDPDAGVFYFSGGFSLGAGGSIDPTTQPVAFSVGSYVVRLPAGFFVKHNTGYVYQKRINGIFLCIFIKFTSTPGSYVLLANRNWRHPEHYHQPGAGDAHDWP